MSNPSKRKGTAGEVAVVEYLRQFFPRAERRTLHGNKDCGDVAGIDAVCIEVKNEARFDLAGWIKELEVEIGHSGADVGAVIAKKRGTTNVGDWYAVLPVRILVDLLVGWTEAYIGDHKNFHHASTGLFV